MTRLKILVVDDKKVIGDLFDFTLGYSGHIITVVNNADDALSALKKEDFDIAFVDIVMPDKDGVQLLEEMKAQAPFLPVVMMRVYWVDEKKEKSRRLGAVTCLKKPFEIDEVKRVIKETIGKEV